MVEAPPASWQLQQNIHSLNHWFFFHELIIHVFHNWTFPDFQCCSVCVVDLDHNDLSSCLSTWNDFYTMVSINSLSATQWCKCFSQILRMHSLLIIPKAYCNHSQDQHRIYRKLLAYTVLNITNNIGKVKDNITVNICLPNLVQFWQELYVLHYKWNFKWKSNAM